MSDKRRTTKQIGVRLDAALIEALEADAVANGRNLTQEVRFLLRRAVTSGDAGAHDDTQAEAGR